MVWRYQGASALRGKAVSPLGYSLGASAHSWRWDRCPRKSESWSPGFGLSWGMEVGLGAVRAAGNLEGSSVWEEKGATKKQGQNSSWKFPSMHSQALRPLMGRARSAEPKQKTAVEWKDLSRDPPGDCCSEDRDDVQGHERQRGPSKPPGLSTKTAPGVWGDGQTCPNKVNSLLSAGSRYSLQCPPSCQRQHPQPLQSCLHSSYKIAKQAKK